MRLRWALVAKKEKGTVEKNRLFNREIITTNIVDHPKTRSRCSPIFMEIFLRREQFATHLERSSNSSATKIVIVIF